MRAKREFRSRDRVEVAILDALVDRGKEGMTVFELRSHVEASIDDIEDALARLKTDDLITVEDDTDRTVILPDDRVVPDAPVEEEEPATLFDELRRRLPF